MIVQILQNDRRHDGDYSSGSSSNQHYRNFSSGNNTSTTSHKIDIEYIHVENDLGNNNSSAETENHHQPSVLPLLEKLSHKASYASSTKSTTNQYVQLESKLYPDIIITRH